VGEIGRAFAVGVVCGVVSLPVHGAWGAEPPTAEFPEEPGAASAVSEPSEAPAPAAEPSRAPAGPAAAGATPVVVHVAAPSAPAPPPPAEPRDLTLSFSPLHLILPVLELQAELRLGDYVGLTAFGGVGRVTVEVPDSYDPRVTDDEELTLYEAGAVLSFYPIEPFENLTLGVELDWVHVSSDDIGDENVQGFATGLSVGPLLGYKHISEAGFTVVAQAGVARIAVHAEASDEVETDEEDDESWVPILNLNLGWSF